MCTYTFCLSQQMSTTTYRDLSIPYIELDPSAYNFSYPIFSDVLTINNFNPPTDGLYLKASFGHRYLSSRPTRTDNHGGLDFWQYHDFQGETYDNSNLVPIRSMCDGYISQVLNDANVESTSTGRSVQVTCDSSFQSWGGDIKINYRHLSNLGTLASIAETAPMGSIPINKGDTIGLMGESGTTTNVHLHMSTQTIHPVYGSAFINTNRLFDPTSSPEILGPLSNATVELLHNWQDSALFRVIWPFNQSINRFEFINQSDLRIFDKEAAYDTGSSIRDNHDCINDIEVYAYQFNGSQTAASRYLNEMNNMPAIYPASPLRDANLSIYGYPHIPITDDGISYVYDFLIKNISPTHLQNDFIVKLSDVWGYTVEAQFITLPVELLFFDVKKGKENNAVIQWATASEMNNQYFIVERSANGADWQKLSQVDGATHSNHRLNYEIIDPSPYLGLSYYRLKQLDYDGNFKYSDIRSIITKEEKPNIIIYPNPASDNIFIETKINPISTLKIYDILGNEVTKDVKIRQTNNKQIEIDISKLNAGLYVLYINNSQLKIFVKK